MAKVRMIAARLATSPEMMAQSVSGHPNQLLTR
jgi:hypothetical protein